MDKGDVSRTLCGLGLLPKSGFQENWRFLNGILTERSQMYTRARGRTTQSRPTGGFGAI